MKLASLLKLHAWLSPAFPTGAFAYSHGIEWAVECGDITSGDSLFAWVEDVLRFGSGRADAIVLRAARDEAVPNPPEESDCDRPVSSLARALAASRERLFETVAQGNAFVLASAAWGGAGDGTDLPYPVAVGRLAAAHAIDPNEAVAGYLQAFAGNLISAAVRLVPLGQTAGLAVLAALAPVILAVERETRTAGIDDIGTACFRSDIAAMRHETQYTRLFRS